MREKGRMREGWEDEGGRMREKGRMREGWEDEGGEGG